MSLNRTYRTIARGIAVAVAGLLCALPAPAQDTLPPVLTIQLRQLAETWNILDQFSARVWPGWSDYRNVPFLFNYPDGMRMLVGHPNPPDGFVFTGVTEEGKKVYVDRRNAILLPMRPPLTGGGGPISVGTLDGKPVTTVSLRLSAAPPESSRVTALDRRQLLTEKQLLLNIHELFHCYQQELYNWRYGNLNYNTDENYAAYAELEGLALERAYREPDSGAALEYLKDFLVARELKRRSMDSTEQWQESEEEMMEGVATYAEMRVLELIRTGYVPRLNRSEDPFFFGFADTDSLLSDKIAMLRDARGVTMDARGKSYSYGAFQALLLNRFLPGWQNGFYEHGEVLDRLIAGLLNLSSEEKRAIAERLNGRYRYDEVLARHARLIGERNDALAMIRKRKGLTFVVNFKNTNEYLHPEGKSFSLGLMNIYPGGISRITIEKVDFKGNNTPMVLDQLYYVQWIDTSAVTGEKGYEVTYTRKDGEDIYNDAVFKTKGFELKAPKIEVTRRQHRVKITILSKIAG